MASPRRQVERRVGLVVTIERVVIIDPSGYNTLASIRKQVEWGLD